LDYAQAGYFDEAIALLEIHTEGKKEMYPMAAYFLGWYHERKNDLTSAKKYYQLAQQMPMDFCFPNRLEEVVVLEAAMALDPKDAKAPYYLGNFWYASRQYSNARDCWENSLKLQGDNAICLRNLALLYFNKADQKELARKHLEQAFVLDSQNARLLMELDQLYKKINVPIDVRLELLEKHINLSLSRDDLYLERIALYNFKGNFEKALELISKRQFHPWEGGEGKVPFQYIIIQVELAKQKLRSGKLKEAVAHLEAAQAYPRNLGEGKLFGAQENDIFYWLGCVHQKLGETSKAKENWKKASLGLSDPSPAMFYNDQQPDKIFYQGLALSKLGRQEEAEHRFKNLITYGKEHLKDEVKLDYFAISLPDLLIWEEDLKVRNRIHCHYLIGLGMLGLGNIQDAISAFNKVLEKDLYHLSATIHYKMAKKWEQDFQKM
jgi:tetratricopeptide (TPR) repeat protein